MNSLIGEKHWATISTSKHKMTISTQVVTIDLFLSFPRMFIGCFSVVCVSYVVKSIWHLWWCSESQCLFVGDEHLTLAQP